MSLDITATLRDLEALGWSRENGISHGETWPASGWVVVTDGQGRHLEHSYTMRDDDSDWRGPDHPVRWTPVEVYEETIRRTRRVERPTPYALDVERAARMLQLEHEAKEKAKREEEQKARDRAEFERLRKKLAEGRE